MPTYKDEKTGSWYCKFYYTDWTGKKKQKLKRGFKLQRDAKDWERLFLEQFANAPDINLSDALPEVQELQREPGETVNTAESTQYDRTAYASVF